MSSVLFNPGRVLLLSLLAAATQAQDTWCGKHYMKGAAVVPPGGQFVFPATSAEPLLNFQCWPATKPFLAGETASLIIDTRITSSKVPGAVPLGNSTNADAPLQVSVSVNGQTHALGPVKLNTTGAELSLPGDALQPQKDPYKVSCTAQLAGSDGKLAETSTEILYLPPPSQGSVVKQDFRTGSLLVPSKGGAGWDPIFPIGFYTSFDGYLTNVSNIDAIKARGLNVIHPVPTFDDQAALVKALDRMEELGIWLMYDMRFTYRNLTSVTEQVNFIKSRKNLLLWYTGDEPDGTSDPLNATKVTYDHINSLDGYHPVSLVLNCQDYFFPQYSLGADVLLQDTYPIGINATFSRVWGTPCTPDFGDCGCDNCVGNLEDISTRMDEFKQRLDLLGRSRSTAVWTVPQAFGNDSYWPRYPTGDEWLVESILGINHGGLGVLPWDDPTSADIRNASSALAAAVPQIVPFLAAPNATFSSFRGSGGGGGENRGVDVAAWGLGDRTLVLAANPGAESAKAELADAGVTKGGGTVAQILGGGGATLVVREGGGVEVTLQGTGTGGWVLSRK